MDSSSLSIEERKSDRIEPIILVHGGTGNIAEKYVGKVIDGVRIAARLGHEFFQKNRSVKDAVIRAVKVMENNPIFNAGRGSSVCFEGVVEMDAIIMNGQTMATGAVSCLRNVRNPIEAACMVMEESHHVLLGGKGAKMFVREKGLPNTEDSHLITHQARVEIDEFHYYGKKPGAVELNELSLRGDSVGVVGIDESGNAVAAKSTGGRTGKHIGQVSAGCAPGASVYADNEWGAVSTSGHDDSVLLHGLSRRILMTLEVSGGKKTLYDAMKETIDDFTEKTKQPAGAIAVSKTGEVAVYFNTPRMAWSYVKGNKVHFGLEPGEDCTEDL